MIFEDAIGRRCRFEGVLLFLDDAVLSPLAVSDFKAGDYQINGTPVALTDMWEANPDWGPWDPASVVASTGLTCTSGNQGPVTKDAVNSLVPFSTGYAYVADVIIGSGGIDFETAELPGYSNGYAARVHDTGVTINHYGEGAIGPLAVTPGSYRVVVRFTPTGVALHLSNGTSLTLSPSTPLTGLNHLALWLTAGTSLVERISFYPSITAEQAQLLLAA